MDLLNLHWARAKNIFKGQNLYVTSEKPHNDSSRVSGSQYRNAIGKLPLRISREVRNSMFPGQLKYSDNYLGLLQLNTKFLTIPRKLDQYIRR